MNKTNIQNSYSGYYIDKKTNKIKYSEHLELLPYDTLILDKVLSMKSYDMASGKELECQGQYCEINMIHKHNKEKVDDE